MWYFRLPVFLSEGFALGLGLGVGILLVEKYAGPTKIGVDLRDEKGRVVVVSGE